MLHGRNSALSRSLSDLLAPFRDRPRRYEGGHALTTMSLRAFMEPALRAACVACWNIMSVAG